MPIAAPISTPKDLDTMKYAPPPFTCIFVASADMDRPVRKVIALERVTIVRVLARPTEPSTHPKRRYMTTPMIVSMLGVNTPLNVPKP